MARRKYLEMRPGRSAGQGSQLLRLQRAPRRPSATSSTMGFAAACWLQKSPATGSRRRWQRRGGGSAIEVAIRRRQSPLGVSHRRGRRRKHFEVARRGEGRLNRAPLSEVCISKRPEIQQRFVGLLRGSLAEMTPLGFFALKNGRKNRDEIRQFCQGDMESSRS
jgi:hypothetical protein